MTIKHPYISSVREFDDHYVVALSDDFPLESFNLAKCEIVGYPSVEADIGFVHDDGAIDFIQGSGDSHAEALTVAIIHFVQLVVHPGGLDTNRFVRIKNA